MQYIAPYSGCTMGEYFAIAAGRVDYLRPDQAGVGYRQVSLLLRPPGAKPIPVTCLPHSRLPSRAARVNVAQKFTKGAVSYKPVRLMRVVVMKPGRDTPPPSCRPRDFDYRRTNFPGDRPFNAGIPPAINAGISASRWRRGAD
jgi:F-type H+-transporting ATPase subunit alpha